MNISALSTPTQIIMAWSLAGVLLLWLIIFSALALRAHQMEQNDLDETPTPAGSFPAVTMQVVHPQTTLAQVSVHVPGTQTPAVPVSFHSGRGLQQIDHAD